MQTIGIICEYNPFHNGHARQLALERERGITLCLMSGNYVQRGEPALLDRMCRARAAVDCGADLVFELPVTYALRSAEGFARGGVELLDRMGSVDILSFGSESGDTEAHLKTAELLLSPELKEPLRAALARGLSFPAAREEALRALGGNGGLLARPNDILAAEYCKAILATGSTIRPRALLRTGDYHAGSCPQAPSAAFLRGREDWTGYVPPAAEAAYKGKTRHTVQAGERAWLSCLRAMGEEDFEALPFGSEGLWRRVMGACRTGRTLEEIIAGAKTRRYTRTRIMRMLLCALLGITAEKLEAPAPYVRLLALGERGRPVLRKILREGTVQVLHGQERGPDCPYGETERRALALYGLFGENGPESPGGSGEKKIYVKGP